jgi:hypothetical protein
VADPVRRLSDRLCHVPHVLGVGLEQRDRHGDADRLIAGAGEGQGDEAPALIVNERSDLEIFAPAWRDDDLFHGSDSPVVHRWVSGARTGLSRRCRAFARHLVPRIEGGSWSGDALTVDPDGGVELPPGRARERKIAKGLPTTTSVNDGVRGGILTIQWLGLMIEIAAGKVS